MMKGILYAPDESLSVSMAMVSTVFMDEFQAMFDMYINKVSIG